MELRRRRRVLEENALFREHVVAGGEGAKGAFVEARENQLLLARIDVDVADGEDAGNAGFETFGIDHDLLAFELETPVFDRAELGLQTEEDKEMVERDTTGHAVSTGNGDFGELAVFFVKACHLTDFKLHFPVFAEFLHLGNGSGRSAEAVATVEKNNAFGLADKVERPVESGVATAADHDVLAFKDGRILAAVVKLGAFEFFDTLNAQLTRLEAADTGGEDDNLTVEAGAEARFNVETAVFLLFNDGNFFTEVEDRVERVNLLEEVFRQFIGRANRNGRDVVDRLGGIEFHALTADRAQRVDNVSLDFEKAEFKHLEEADGTGTDDDGIGFNHFVRRFCDGHVVFNCHFLWEISKATTR